MQEGYGYARKSTKESNQNYTKTQEYYYEMRIKECGLTTLKTRRLRGEQIEVFKMLNAYENIDRNILFSVNSLLRRPSKTAQQPHCSWAFRLPQSDPSFTLTSQL